MDISLALGIVGTVATVALGVLGIYVTVRHRYPGQIELVTDSCIPLFNAIVKNLPELSVVYKNSPVSERLILLRAYLVNTGRKDISPEMVAERLSVALPNGYVWRTAKVTAHSSSIRASVEVKAGELLFDLGLFRCDEYIVFEALAEAPASVSSAEFIKVMAVRHRISDTQPVKVTRLLSEGKRREVLPSLVSVFLIPIVFVGIFAYRFFSPGSSDNLELQYVLRQPNGETIEARVRPLPNSTIGVEPIDGRPKYAVSAQDFSGSMAGPPLIKPKRFTAEILLGLPTALSLLFMFLVGRDLFRRRRLTRLLAADQHRATTRTQSSAPTQGSVIGTSPADTQLSSPSGIDSTSVDNTSLGLKSSTSTGLGQTELAAVENMHGMEAPQPDNAPDGASRRG